MVDADSNDAAAVLPLLPPPYHHDCMGEVYPRLWVGSLQAVAHVLSGHWIPTQRHHNDSGVVGDTFSASNSNNCNISQWTVISVLESEQLLQLVRRMIAESIIISSNDETSDTTIPISPHRKSVVDRHVEWKLADSSQSAFLSTELANILCEMDHAVLSDTNEETSCLLRKDDSTTTNTTSTLTRTSNRHCLVHCAQGRSRSVAVCAAWLLKKRLSTTLEQALDMIRTTARRPQARPNLGFIAALRALEQCQGDVTAAIQRASPK